MVPTTLRAINEVCHVAEYQKAQGMFTRTSLHNHGLFDWKEIFKGPNLQFS